MKYSERVQQSSKDFKAYPIEKIPSIFRQTRRDAEDEETGGYKA